MTLVLPLLFTLLLFPPHLHPSFPSSLLPSFSFNLCFMETLCCSVSILGLSLSLLSSFLSVYFSPSLLFSHPLSLCLPVCLCCKAVTVALGPALFFTLPLFSGEIPEPSRPGLSGAWESRLQTQIKSPRPSVDMTERSSSPRTGLICVWGPNSLVDYISAVFSSAHSWRFHPLGA